MREIARGIGRAALYAGLLVAACPMPGGWAAAIPASATPASPPPPRGTAGAAGPAASPAQARPEPVATGTPPAVAADAPGGPWRIDEALWDRPRSGSSVRAVPAVRAAVQAWLATPATRLAIRHGSGQNGQPRAIELRQWLVALGVDPGALLVEAVDRPGSSLELSLLPAPR
ncbi:MAG: hypothetical protein ACK5TE_06305 [Pseudomonadota bacterium]|jgi:hypothetical protein